MRLEKVFAVFLKELKVIARERRLLAIIIAQPIILVSVFGYAFSGEINNVGVAVVDEDGSELSHKFISALHSTDKFDIKYFVYSRSEAIELVKLGKVHYCNIHSEELRGRVQERLSCCRGLRGRIELQRCEICN